LCKISAFYSPAVLELFAKKVKLGLIYQKNRTSGNVKTKELARALAMSQWTKDR